MLSKREFTNFSAALGTLCFADNVVLALAQVRKTGTVRPQDRPILQAAEKFFGDVIRGYEWSEHPAINSQSVQSAAAFANAFEALAPELRLHDPERVLQYFRQLHNVTKELSSKGSTAPEKLGVLQQFFTAFGYSQLERTKDVADRANKHEAASWLMERS